MTPSEAILAAYVDGELAEAERRSVEAAIADDPALRARTDRMFALRARLTAHYSPVVDEPLPGRLARLLEADTVVDLNEARARRATRLRPPSWGQAAAVAASLLLGLAVGRFGLKGPGPDVVSRDGVLLARGTLARSLDTQLASSQSPTAPVRIGISFRDSSDRLCRTFTSAAIAGLACHAGDQWRLQATSAPEPSAPETAYRQAASPAPLILQAAQALMKGAPLDAPAERAALSSLTHKPSDGAR